MMANKYLAREDAPFGADVWEVLDAAMVEAAKGELAGRRLLHVEGPFGLGLKAVPLQDEEAQDGLITAGMLPLSLIYKPFTLGARDLANYEREDIVLDTGPVFEAAIAAARQEDSLIFNGASGVLGLLEVEGAHQQNLSAWEEMGAAANDVIQAITVLDDGGFHGPYALALAPARYNLLFRLYQRGNQSEMEHVRAMATEGVFKAPVLESGGVLLASGRRYASIVLGQDMHIGFIGPAGSEIEFAISESLALYIRQPQAICVLKG
jgi:uncharacterized linocin/CFP29 family protein